MKMRARLGVAVAATTSAIMMTLGFAQPAHAASSYISVWEVWANGCPGGYVCLSYDWQNQYNGYGFYYDVWNMSSTPSPYRYIDNAAKSARNSGTSSYGTVRFYDLAGGSGTSRCLRKGYSASSLGVLDNRTSALIWASGCGSVTPF